MKKWSQANKKMLLLVGVFLLLATIGFTGFVRSSTKFVHAASTPTTSLSATSGPPGTHIFITVSGYGSQEKVQPIWNYNGTGRPLYENSFYYFSPIGTTDTTGAAHTSIFIPTYSFGNYTIAVKGLTSGIISTAVFHLTPMVETGIYIGKPGTTLRLRGWGFGLKENISLYWNWVSPANPGQAIGGTTVSDNKGTFNRRSFVVPAGTANGAYNVAAVGATSKAVAVTMFTVGTPVLNTQQGVHDWVNFGYDAQGTRVNSTETAISTANASTLAVKWKSAFPITNRIAGSPLVINGTVYVSTVQGTVVAFNATNGSTKWVFNANGPIYGSPTVQGGIVYFGTVNYPGEGLIGNYAYALNANDGSLIWKNYLDYGADWVTPLVYNNVVYMPSAGREAASGGFNAFNATDGSLVWQFPTLYGIWASPTMDPTGASLFVNGGNPCLDSGGGNCSGSFLKLNPANGSIVWKTQVPDLSGDDDIAATPTYNNGYIYSGVKNGLFYAVNATTGAIVWKYDTGKRGDSGIFSSAAFYQNRVFFEGGDGYTHALNTTNGSVAWLYHMTSTVNLPSPIEANGVLYAAGGDGSVFAINVATGAGLWSAKTGATISSSPTISNGVLYVSSSDGYLYAYSPKGV